MRTPLERTEEVTSHAEGVVHHHADALFLCQLCNRLIIRNVECRVAEVFQIYGLRPAVDQLLDVLGLVALCETDFDSHVAKGDGKHSERASIEEWLCNDVVTRTADIGDREEHR